MICLLHCEQGMLAGKNRRRLDLDQDSALVADAYWLSDAHTPGDPHDNEQG
jgi:hypothetical protein